VASTSSAIGAAIGSSLNFSLNARGCPLPELVEGKNQAYNIPMPYVYILECADGSYYTGSTWDIEARLYQHQSGIGSNHTKLRLPVKLVFSEEYDRIDEAFAREKQIQGWSHRKKKALIDSNFYGLVRLSKNYSQYGKPEDMDSR
jgi:putative endonuclease